MRCRNCNAENSEGQKFCDNCGASLTNRCPRCGAATRPGQRFCGDCGRALTPAAPASAPRSDSIRVQAVHESDREVPKGERKMVTALFADLKGSTELMEGLDPEEARAIIDPALTLMIDAVRRYDGYVVQSTGDGIFAMFGAPVAHEDHPQRALYAAMRMRDELRRYSAEVVADGGNPIQGRIGVNTGEIVVRNIETGERQVEYTPIGHTVNLASRMQAVAPIGSIAATDATRKLCEGYFLFTALGPTRVRGVSEPVEVHEVTGLGPLKTRLQAAMRRGLSRFVGRNGELAQMKRALELARNGHGQIVAAIGEPGIGKSRLFFEFKAVSQSGTLVLEAYSVSHGKASAYLPLIELLRDYFRIAADDDAKLRREKVIGKLLALDRALEDTLLCVLALVANEAGVQPLMQMDPQIRRRRTQDAVKRILLRESLDQPLVIVFEDLHWIDGETQQFLNILADAIANTRILLLVDYRPEYHHQWGNRSYYTQLRLDPLRQENEAEMLSALLGDSAELQPFKRMVTERAQGNPFFVEEIVQALFDQGVLAHNGNIAVLRPLAQVNLPATVQGMLAARIDRLAPDEKELLQTLAAVGRDFRLRLIQKLADCSDVELNRMLAALEAAEFIYEQPAMGDVEYVFKHALTQEVAYNSMLVERRRLLHGRIGEAIESLFAARLDDRIKELAHQYSRSDNLTKAVHYLHRAGEQAAARSFEEAMSQLSTALEFLQKLEPSSSRDAQELAIRVALTNPLFVVNPFPAAQLDRNLRRARELSERLGQMQLLARVLLNFFFANWVSDDLGLMRETARMALELASRTRISLTHFDQDRYLYDAEIIVFCAGWTNGFLAAWTGEYSAARAHLERALAISPSTEASLLKDPGIAISLVDTIEYLAFMLWMLGCPEQARRHEQRLASLTNNPIDPFAWAIDIHGILMIRCEFLRDFQGMKEQAEELLRRSREGGTSYTVVLGLVWLGRIMVAEGEFDAGIRTLVQGMDAFKARGDVGSYDLFRYTAAVAYLQAGRVERGLTVVREAIAKSGATSLYGADLYRLEGEFLLMAGALEDEVEKSFRQAIAIAQRQEAKSWELRATISLARLLTKRGKRDEAHAMLGDIYNWFTEGFDTADLKDAKALLEACNINSGIAP